MKRDSEGKLSVERAREMRVALAELQGQVDEINEKIAELFEVADFELTGPIPKKTYGSTPAVPVLPAWMPSLIVGELPDERQADAVAEQVIDALEEMLEENGEPLELQEVAKRLRLPGSGFRDIDPQKIGDAFRIELDDGRFVLTGDGRLGLAGRDE